jgi:dTDP-glucose pyrophosphorylase
MKCHDISKSVSNVIVDKSKNLNEALNVVSRGGYQVALVCSNDSTLLGILTDSDARKALSNALDLKCPVSVAMNPAPIVVNREAKPKDVCMIMLNHHIFHVPVVDNEGKLVGLYVADQLVERPSLTERLVIMAGGKGRRLMPLTATTPKPMLLIDGKPILENIIANARDEGFKNITISVNYLAEQIEAYFGNGEELGININYIHEDSPLGTAGSLAQLKQNYTCGPLVVMNGDIVTDISLYDVLQRFYREQADALIVAREYIVQVPYGVIEVVNDTLTEIREKPSIRKLVNAGIYIIGNRLLKQLAENEYCDMTDLLNKGLQKDMIIKVFPMHEKWIDIGRPSDYDRAINQTNS